MLAKEHLDKLEWRVVVPLPVDPDYDIITCYIYVSLNLKSTHLYVNHAINRTLRKTFKLVPNKGWEVLEVICHGMILDLEDYICKL